MDSKAQRQPASDLVKASDAALPVDPASSAPASASSSDREAEPQKAAGVEQDEDTSLVEASVYDPVRSDEDAVFDVEEAYLASIDDESLNREAEPEPIESDPLEREVLLKLGLSPGEPSGEAAEAVDRNLGAEWREEYRQFSENADALLLVRAEDMGLGQVDLLRECVHWSAANFWEAIAGVPQRGHAAFIRRIMGLLDRVHEICQLDGVAGWFRYVPDLVQVGSIHHHAAWNELTECLKLRTKRPSGTVRADALGRASDPESVVTLQTPVSGVLPSPEPEPVKSATPPDEAPPAPTAKGAGDETDKVSIKDAAAALRRSPGTISKWCKRSKRLVAAWNERSSGKPIVAKVYLSRVRELSDKRARRETNVEGIERRKGELKQAWESELASRQQSGSKKRLED